MTDPVSAQYRDMAYASGEVWVIQMWDSMNNQLYRKAQEMERLRTEILEARRTGRVPEAFWLQEPQPGEQTAAGPESV